MKLTFVLAAALLVACKGKAGGGDCSVVNGAVDRVAAEQRKAIEGQIPPEKKTQFEDAMTKMAGKMKTVAVKACTEDKWSAEALTCMDSAKTQAELEACDEKLTPAQSKKAEQAINAVIQETMASLAPSGGAPPAGGADPDPGAPEDSGEGSDSP